MNFGRHGRTVLLGALLASSTTVVFGGMVPGVAGAPPNKAANPNTIKVGSYPRDNSGNGNDPHVDNACVGVHLFGFDADGVVNASFTAEAPTKGAKSLAVSGTASEVMSYDIKAWLATLT